jgi:hypothetical protein
MYAMVVNKVCFSPSCLKEGTRLLCHTEGRTRGSKNPTKLSYHSEDLFVLTGCLLGCCKHLFSEILTKLVLEGKCFKLSSPPLLISKGPSSF